MMRPSNIEEGAAPSLPVAAIAALQQGNKIEAIKIVRQERNLGLKEAKDAVDEYVRSQPSLQSALASAQSETRRVGLLWLAVIIVVAALGYYFLTKP
jgi:ribosomal protein L7/L12